MTQLRERWEGVSLPGDYLLETWLGGDEAAGFFATSVLADGRRAVVKLVPESAADGAAQLALWERVRSLRHPHLRALLDCGRAQLATKMVVYAVFESADDTLAAALARLPLSEAEAREVLAAVLAALGCLQAHGLALPALDPEHVVAVGEQIKLSTDNLREAASDAPDTSELRAFWHKISPCTPARREEILAQALGADPYAAPAENPAPAEIPPTKDVAPPAAPAAAAQMPLILDVAPPAAKRFPKWVLVGAAGVVLLILGLNLRRPPEPLPPPAPAPSEARTTAPAAPIGAPAVPKASPFRETIRKPPSQSSPAPKAMWRVIAFTYLSRDAAARKADELNQSHPDFQASVFAPQNKQGRYLVALGGFMTRQDAVSLQKKARAQGLSRDVFVHNYVD
ncbi:MAG: SPOR domain-containing protein [Candidatus Solibacter sp.]|jgi:hypothetical protein